MRHPYIHRSNSLATYRAHVIPIQYIDHTIDPPNSITMELRADAILRKIT